MQSLRIYIRNCVSRKSSLNLLNYFTLQIRDKEISQQYASAQANHFNRIFYPILILASLYTIRHIIQVLLTPNQSSIFDLIGALEVLGFSLIWYLVKCRYNV